MDETLRICLGRYKEDPDVYPNCQKTFQDPHFRRTMEEYPPRTQRPIPDTGEWVIVRYLTKIRNHGPGDYLVFNLPVEGGKGYRGQFLMKSVLDNKTYNLNPISRKKDIDNGLICIFVFPKHMGDQPVPEPKVLVPVPEPKVLVPVPEPKVLTGDVIDKMKELGSETIDSIITSPPYWGQRDYDSSDQWGNETEVAHYLERMDRWAEECKRVLKNEGTLFLNIGDKYGKKSLQMVPERLCIRMCDNGWCLRNKIVWYKPNHQPSGVKDRFVNTWEYIYFFTKDSGKYFNYRYYHDIDALRLQHENQSAPPPDHGFPDILSVTDYEDGDYATKIDEYNKNKKYSGKYINQDKNIGGSAGGRKSKGIGYSRQRFHSLSVAEKTQIHRYLKKHLMEWKTHKKGVSIDELLGYKNKAGHWFREDPGRSLPSPTDWPKLKGILSYDDTYDEVMTKEHYVLQSVKNNPKGKNPGDMWDIPLQHSKEKHFAQFPMELPTRILRGFCPPGGVVLDTFAGSGTTGLAAMKQGVQSIMIELNPEFSELMKTRFQAALSNE